jgi:SprT-like family.
MSKSQKVLLGTLVLCGSDLKCHDHFVFLKVCDTADRLRDTLVHEMCHAAVWILNGVKNGHGHLWNAWYVHIILSVFC